MVSDKLLSEIERQKKYLADLPQDFVYPLFNVKYAVESQRSSGYRHTAAASREIIDNAVESGAENVHVVFETDMGTGRRSVSAVAFIDDGPGMIPEMVRYALTWGGGTHFDDHDFIGKFGFGLPNSSINQTRRVEVYSRTASDQPFVQGVLDINKVDKFGVQRIEDPQPAELPEFVLAYLKKNGITLDHGTVVVWVRPDRLSYKRAANLKESMLDDFGVTYRYLLNNKESRPDGVRLVVEGVEVAPVDPLFISPGARYYMAPPKGAHLVERRSLVVRYYRDPDSGETHLDLVQGDDELQAAITRGETVGTINVTVARFPVGFAQPGESAVDDDARRRFEIRKAHRGMSFVRAGREIQTVDLFPRTNKDKSSGLGNWPLLQSYAYHWGIEVRFDPELDEVFGITNDKQSVRPLEDFWRVLAQAEVDAAVRRENTWQRKEREKPKKAESTDAPSDAELTAKVAASAINQRPEVPERGKAGARKSLEKVAKQRAKKTEVNIDEARKALEAEAKRRPYKIDYADVPSGPWFDAEWVGEQLVVTVNRQHQFYQVLYGDLMKLRGANRAKEALDLVVIALARDEWSIDDPDKAAFVASRRRFVTTQFMETGLAALAARMAAPEEAAEEVEDEESAGAA